MPRSAAIVCAVWVFLAAGVCQAQTIRQPGQHPAYAVDVEPHLAFGVIDPPGRPSGGGIGVGARVAIPVMHNGFVPTINNSIAISFGLDWLYYTGGELTTGWCERWADSPGPTETCTRVHGPVGGPAHFLYFPAAMQWNFWFSEKFSAFGEPGLALFYSNARYADADVGVVPTLQVGGRWHFTRLAALTLRLGYPTSSLGVSMLF